MLLSDDDIAIWATGSSELGRQDALPRFAPKLKAIRKMARIGYSLALLQKQLRALEQELAAKLPRMHQVVFEQVLGNYRASLPGK
jgi:hypothetical protein